MAFLNSIDGIPEIGDTLVEVKHTSHDQFGMLKLFFKSGKIVTASTINREYNHGKPSEELQENK